MTARRRGATPAATPADAPIAARGLRLRGEDAEDLAVISACLQDALVAVRDLAYDRGSRLFTMVANRFCWESGTEGDGFERTMCAVAFAAVDEVVYRGFQRSEEDRILSLLAIRPAAPAPPDALQADGAAPPPSVIDLEFAAGAAVRLSAAEIRCRARDLGEPWPTVWQPNHPLDLPR